MQIKLNSFHFGLYYYLGPHSTPFFNDSCSDTETTTGEDALLQSAMESSHFMHIKEEIENDAPYYKSNNNIPLNSFNGKFNCSVLKGFLHIFMFAFVYRLRDKQKENERRTVHGTVVHWWLSRFRDAIVIFESANGSSKYSTISAWPQSY